MMSRRLAFVALLAPLALPAQVMPARVVRRGSGVEITDGEPVSFFIEHSRDLELTDAQRDTMMAIRRRLRAQNAPYTRQLDSLRDVLGIDLEPRARISDKDMERLERFRKLSAPITDSMRVYNDAAKAEAWELLLPAQRSKVDSLLKEDRAARGREKRGQPNRRPEP